MPDTADADPEIAVVILPDEPLAELIVQQIRAARPGQDLSLHASLAGAAAAHKTSQLLLVLPDPAESLARLLQATGSTEAALTGWKSQADTVLSQVQQHHRRLWLVDARAVASADPETLSLFATDPEVAAPEDIPAPPDPVFMVLAHTLLAHDAGAGQIAEEIADLRRGAGDAFFDLEQCEAALIHYLGLVEGQGAAAAAQESLAHYKDLAADRNLHKAKAESLQKQLDDTLARMAERDSVVAGILLADQARGDADRKRTEALEQELQRVYQSRSWWITRPLRAFRRSGRS